MGLHDSDIQFLREEGGTEHKSVYKEKMSANQEQRSVPVVKDKKVPSLISPICFVVALR